MKILLIAPIYFDYEKAIKYFLDIRYDVAFFQAEVPFNSSVKYYALKRFSKLLANSALCLYNEHLLKLIKKHRFERILIIRGYGINEEFLQQVQNLPWKIEVFHYQWDSLVNNPIGKMISRYADYNFSFDIHDVIENPQFKHLPLFYTWDTIPDDFKPDSFKQDIDLLFIGGYHSLRNKIVLEATQQCQRFGFTVKSHIYYPIGSYVRDRLSAHSVCLSDVKFRKVSRLDYYKYLCRSRAVLDIQSSTQSGATIRTIETLSLCRKLVSTNAELQKENFYNSRNIQIWDPANPLDISTLISTPFDYSNSHKVLSLEQWLSEIGI